MWRNLIVQLGIEVCMLVKLFLARSIEWVMDMYMFGKGNLSRVATEKVTMTWILHGRNLECASLE